MVIIFKMVITFSFHKFIHLIFSLIINLKPNLSRSTKWLSVRVQVSHILAQKLALGEEIYSKNIKSSSQVQNSLKIESLGKFSSTNTSIETQINILPTAKIQGNLCHTQVEPIATWEWEVEESPSTKIDESPNDSSLASLRALLSDDNFSCCAVNQSRQSKLEKISIVNEDCKLYFWNSPNLWPLDNSKGMTHFLESMTVSDGTFEV